MELIAVLVLGWIGWKALQSVRPTLKAADYFMACQVSLMKLSDVELSTAKAFVADYHFFFASAFEHGSTVEQAVFTCCQFLLDGSMTDKSITQQHIATATRFGHGVVRLMPESLSAKEFKKLLAPYAA